MNTTNYSQARPHTNTRRRPRIPRFAAYRASTERREDPVSVATARVDDAEDDEDADDELPPPHKRARVHRYEFRKEEQANILKILKRYGLVNASNEITPDQAEFFHTYANSQEQEIAELEKKLEGQREDIKNINEQHQENIQQGVDLMRFHRKQTRCLAAKRGTMRTLRAIIDERNANIDFVENQVVKLENQVAYLSKELSTAETKRVLEMQVEAQELEKRQKMLSDRMSDIK
ncbi:hypothetical protein IFR05_001071 [Cadophora sp. M221]|nr:hypothetical protein IFR05_001071 [Cadophora sp. M221]